MLAESSTIMILGFGPLGLSPCALFAALQGLQ
jgi:hypothetical protein